MRKLDGRDCIFLIWKDPVTREQIAIGQLLRNGDFEFQYLDGVNHAKNLGFQLLPSFPDPEKIYTSKVLFTVFSSRLPDPKRKDIKDILNRYDLKEYDGFDLLKKSGASLPIDNLEFVDPLSLEMDEDNLIRIFPLAGSRHYIACKGEDCELFPDLEEGEQLYLEEELSNEFDRNAIKVLSSKKEHIGYIPRYYCYVIKQWLKEGKDIYLEIYKINKDRDCNHCVKIKLKVVK